jgi:hypothetical protein
MKNDDAFLLHPANRAFLDGKSRLPRGMARPGLYVAGVIAMFLTLSGPVLIGKVLWEERKIERLTRYGVKTHATILKIDASADPDASSDSDTNTVTYRFVAGPIDSARTYEVEVPVGAEHSGGLHVGWDIDIRYDPADPSVSALESRIREPGPEAIRAVFWFLVAATLVGAFWLVVWFIRGVRPLWRLIREGRTLPGEVVECGGRMRGDDYLVTLTYRFTDPDGHELEGRMEAVRDDLADAVLPAARTPILVYYVDSRTYAVL